MKSILKVAVAVCAAIAAMSPQAKAQVVQMDGLGSSAYFLEAGLGANYSGGSINAPCVWSDNTNAVSATDTSVSPSAVDKGNAWVAWTPGSGGSCTAPASDAKVYAYLQTDSVVGNRCLFNANIATPTCTIAYPTTLNPAPANLILSGGVLNCGTTGECPLPTSIETALNSSTAKVNFAGSDIRPEDAEFATFRALQGCGTALAGGAGAQYLGLGYSNGDKIGSPTNTSTFNVVNFALPSTFVTLVGATPVVVTANGTGIAAGSISAQTLANLLDGTYFYTGQVSSSPSMTGSALTVYLREPLSGTYNTMEYNIPNSTVAQTSQDVGLNQPLAQKNCAGSVPAGTNGSTPPTYTMNITTGTVGGVNSLRQREIGTGNELAAVRTNTANALGYGFWSAANFAGFTSAAAPNAKYLKVSSFSSSTGIDPLLGTGSTYTGTIPTPGSADMANVTLGTTANGTYPIWSLLRIVTLDTTTKALADQLAASTDTFVNFGTSTSRPDFVVPTNMTVVRSHFIPVAGSGYPATAANGDNALGTTLTACTDAEAGGDVGGVPLRRIGAAFNGFPSDNTYCTNTPSTTGQTGHRF